MAELIMGTTCWPHSLITALHYYFARQYLCCYNVSNSSKKMDAGREYYLSFLRYMRLFVASVTNFPAARLFVNTAFFALY